MLPEKTAVMTDNQYLLRVKTELGLDAGDFRIGYKNLSNYLCNLIPAALFRTYLYNALRPIKDLKTEVEKRADENYEVFSIHLKMSPTLKLDLDLYKKMTTRFTDRSRLTYG